MDQRIAETQLLQENTQRGSGGVPWPALATLALPVGCVPPPGVKSVTHLSENRGTAAAPPPRTHGHIPLPPSPATVRRKDPSPLLLRSDHDASGPQSNSRGAQADTTSMKDSRS
ncbi:hypothetical protein VTN00DRAFT_2214 [Thermoascus crustaceus]|uniref:uncharacterized protein n=1 Tax=Thermoascus crustaceus TaxID=5088 RepID=UPI003741F891